MVGKVLLDGVDLAHPVSVKVSEPTIIDTRPVPGELPTRIYLGKEGRKAEIQGWVATVAELNALSGKADGAPHDLELPTGEAFPIYIPEVTPIRSAFEPGYYPYTIRAAETMISMQTLGQGAWIKA